MRVHFVIAALVLLATLILRLERVLRRSRRSVLIALVLSLELMNTAIEAIVDLLTVAHHPLAKIAKDAAAGAVLIAAIGAVIAAYLIFYQGIISGGARVFVAVQSVPANVALIVLAVVAIATIFAKAWVGRGSALQGGAVSGHAALGLCRGDHARVLLPEAARGDPGLLRGLPGRPEPGRGADPPPLRGLLGSRPRHARRPGDLRAGAAPRCAIMAPI